MIIKELAENIILNIDQIFENMNTIFNISKDEMTKIITHILYIDDDVFYKSVINSKSLLCFSEKNLIKLKNYLKEMTDDDNLIKNIIVYIPEILLFSNNCNNIFPLYKSNEFKGIVLLNNEKYKAYDYHSYFLNPNYNIFYDGNLNMYRVKKRNDIQECEIIVQSMLELLSRKDIMDYYGLNNNSTLEDKFYALSSRYNKRNYYFYKSENPLIGLKAKSTTYQEDGKYHCDICNKGFNVPDSLKTYHIVPLSEGGADEIYNIACLCDKCYSFIGGGIKIHTMYDKNFTDDDLLIKILKARINNKVPGYSNKVNSYFRKR